MTFLTVEAFGLEEIEHTLIHKYYVQVWDRTNQPSRVVFIGPREGLIQMYKDHWHWPEGPDEAWLSETAPDVAKPTLSTNKEQAHSQWLDACEKCCVIMQDLGQDSPVFADFKFSEES